MPAVGNGPGSGGCLCPARPPALPLPWVGPSCVLGGAGHLPPEGLPTLRPPLGAHSCSPTQADVQRQMRDSSRGNGEVATPEHLARVAVPGRGQGRAARAATGKVLSWTQAPCAPSYLTSIPTSPPCLVRLAAAHRLLQAPASSSQRLAVLSPFANMLLSPLVPQNQCR